MANKDGFDSKKRWGNSAIRGHGVNSPAMMEDRKRHEIAKKMNLKKEIDKLMWKNNKDKVPYNKSIADKNRHRLG